MQQLENARQHLVNLGYQINLIGNGGRVDPLHVKQAMQSVSTALTAMVSALDAIDKRGAERKVEHTADNSTD